MEIPKSVVDDLAGAFGRSKALQMFDLGQHAASEAISTLERICKTAPDKETELLSSLIALRLLGATAEKNISAVIAMRDEYCARN